MNQRDSFVEQFLKDNNPLIGLYRPVHGPKPADCPIPANSPIWTVAKPGRYSPRGMVLMFKQNDVVRLGWSLCRTTTKNPRPLTGVDSYLSIPSDNQKPPRQLKDVLYRMGYEINPIKADVWNRNEAIIQCLKTIKVLGDRSVITKESAAGDRLATVIGQFRIPGHKKLPSSLRKLTLHMLDRANKYYFAEAKVS